MDKNTIALFFGFPIVGTALVLLVLVCALAFIDWLNDKRGR